MSEPMAAEKEQKNQSKSSSYGASCTSHYTTEEKKDVYETLQDVLDKKCSDPLVKEVIKDLMNVCADITNALRISLVTVEGSTNDFGDSLLSVDVCKYPTKMLVDVFVLKLNPFCVNIGDRR